MREDGSRSLHPVNFILANRPMSSGSKIGMAVESDITRGAMNPADWPNLSMEDRFSLVVEASPMALVLAGPSGRIEMVNRQAEQLFGYAREDLVGKPLEILVPERFRGLHIDLRREFMVDASSRQMGAGRDLHGLRKDGTEFPLEIGLNPIGL